MLAPPVSIQSRVEVSRRWFGLIRVAYQEKTASGKWRTADSYYTRSLQKPPREGRVWVWGFLIMIGVLKTPAPPTPIITPLAWTPLKEVQSVGRATRGVRIGA